MNNQNTQEENNAANQTGKSGNSNKVDIQPSETDSKIQNQTGDPGRTPGKAEGSSKTVEEDLAEKENG